MELYGCPRGKLYSPRLLARVALKRVLNGYDPWIPWYFQEFQLNCFTKETKYSDNCSTVTHLGIWRGVIQALNSSYDPIVIKYTLESEAFVTSMFHRVVVYENPSWTNFYAPEVVASEELPCTPFALFEGWLLLALHHMKRLQYWLFFIWSPYWVCFISPPHVSDFYFIAWLVVGGRAFDVYQHLNSSSTVHKQAAKESLALVRKNKDHVS